MLIGNEHDTGEHLDLVQVNANWSRNLLIASRVLGRAAGISWHSMECEQEMTLVRALDDAMRESEYNYEQLVEGLGLLARYLIYIDVSVKKSSQMPMSS